jgi:hypothetical protein
MTPQQKIKHLILNAHAKLYDEPEREVTAENVDEVYGEADGDDYGLQDARGEVRGGEVETGLPCQYSRHYESKAVAARAPDGSWVGWTYWFGGGKHGEPESIDWIDDAYDLTCIEEQKLVTVRTFSKIDA